MKRRTKLLKNRSDKKAAKAAGMKNPGGESKYAQKKRGSYTPDPGAPRASWFLRSGLAAIAQEQGERNGHYDRTHQRHEQVA